ncbi:hypothetical protein N7457_003534 [Penicillium paradoxum]|uniref:uncharacterized protein n=1 Tax=Penicillium paradoxum TaxID=176176 RepID=UPI0025471066|nr:uncharacterized protein N7457_003534 [Penicillium paradoxum]KAJ5788544.1 hypothetical protein N7457_003534 [Penicillium paradoxum]
MSNRNPSTRSTQFGLLTQSLVPSPVINWILPARLRNKNHNDVVFIGERRIQIKEALESGHLEDVVEKTDLEGSIIGAKVINVSTQLPWEPQAPSSLAAHPSVTENLPPQILFLAMDTNELLFMYYSKIGDSPFVSYIRPLPRDVTLADTYGAYIAVDPKSRAVAVSASRGFFGLMWLKAPIDLQMQMLNGQLDPLKNENFFQVDGDILFMEFLYPKTSNDSRVILLVVVRSRHTTRSFIYEWDEGIILTNGAPRCNTKSLPPQDQFPTMVIPLAKESSYLLVTTNSMAMYTPNSSSLPMRYPPIIPDAESSQAGLWTRWARPSRNWMYSQRYDGIFLCHENGWIYYLEFGNDGELETQTSLGQLHCAVDTAFDILDMGREGGDFILAAGSQGDGGLFVQEARDHPKCVQRFLNWAPVPDAVVIPSDSPGPRLKMHPDHAQDRIFVCSTSASGNGAITELRHGIEAQIGVSVELDGLSSIRNMWAMSRGYNDSIYLTVSDPLSSFILHTTPDMRNGIIALDDCGFANDVQTLAMGCTHSGVIIQVTENAIQMFVPGEPSLSTSHDVLANVTAAIVDGPTSTVVLATRRSDGHFLHLYRVFKTSAKISLSNDEAEYMLPEEPICISHYKWEDIELVFIGTGSGTVLSFEFSRCTGTFMRHKDTHVSLGAPQGKSKAVESLAVVETLSGVNLRAVLFWGLRGGTLVPFKLDMVSIDSRGKYVFGFRGMRQQESRDLGRTSIRIKSHGSYAWLTCGDDFWRVWYENDNFSDFCLIRVWITDQNRPAYFPTRFSSFDLVDMVDPVSGLATVYMFCFADSHVLICSLDQNAKTIPRRIALPGNPNKISFSHHLQRLIVSYTVAQDTSQTTPLELVQTCCIEFVDPNTQHPVVPYDAEMVTHGLLPWRPNGSPGEKITCIVDWMPEKDGNPYHFIAIGTSIPLRDEPNKRHGRLILIQTSKDPNNPDQILCTKKHLQSFEDSIFAMAPFGLAVIVACGRRFIAVKSSSSKLKWAKKITASLPSTAVTMTVDGTWIYVTTAKHSLVVYEIINNNLILDIIQKRADFSPRLGLTHAFMPLHNKRPDILFVSTRGGATRAFTDIRHAGQLLPCATANLPVSLVKISRGFKSPHSLKDSGYFYGFGIDGSVYRFLLLSMAEWRLLQILTSLCMRDPGICPSLSRRRRYLDLVYSVENKMHVDGSILSRLASRGSSYLDRMLNKCSEGQIKDLTPDTVRMFSETAKEVLGTPTQDTHLVLIWLWEILRVEC